MGKLLYPELSYKICGLLFYIHNKLGRFRKEKEYADALEIVLKENSVDYLREARVDNSILDKKFSLYRLDFFIEDKIVLEIKSKPTLSRNDFSQLRKYLDSKNSRLGLLVNFREKYLKPKRIAN